MTVALQLRFEGFLVLSFFISLLHYSLSLEVEQVLRFPHVWGACGSSMVNFPCNLKQRGPRPGICGKFAPIYVNARALMYYLMMFLKYL
jgi:hypothetical protein